MTFRVSENPVTAAKQLYGLFAHVIREYGPSIEEGTKKGNDLANLGRAAYLVANVQENDRLRDNLGIAIINAFRVSGQGRTDPIESIRAILNSNVGNYVMGKEVEGKASLFDALKDVDLSILYRNTISRAKSKLPL